MRPEKRKPAGGNLRASDAVSGLRALYGKGEATRQGKGWQSPRLPDNWRHRLPDPAAYYGARIGKLSRPNGSGWAQGPCPFHDDHDASLSVHVTEGGGWRCFAGCGSGDMVSFHQRARGCDFKQAVVELVRGAA